VLASGVFGGDRLFVHADVYDWRISYEQSISAYYLGERVRERFDHPTTRSAPTYHRKS
jgi:hypothetical protein